MNRTILSYTNYIQCQKFKVWQNIGDNNMYMFACKWTTLHTLTSTSTHVHMHVIQKYSYSFDLASQYHVTLID